MTMKTIKYTHKPTTGCETLCPSKLKDDHGEIIILGNMDCHICQFNKGTDIINHTVKCAK